MIVAVVLVVVTSRVAAVVAARGAASGGSPAASAPARVQEYAYDDHDHNYNCDYQERFQCGISLPQFPQVWHQSTGKRTGVTTFHTRLRAERMVFCYHEYGFAGVVYEARYSKSYTQGCDEWIERRSW